MPLQSVGDYCCRVCEFYGGPMDNVEAVESIEEFEVDDE